MNHHENQQQTADDPGIEVTVKDLKTGQSESATIRNDYVIVTGGRCEVTHVQRSGNGTHVLTVKGSQR